MLTVFPYFDAYKRLHFEIGIDQYNRGYARRKIPVFTSER